MFIVCQHCDVLPRTLGLFVSSIFQSEIVLLMSTTCIYCPCENSDIQLNDRNQLFSLADVYFCDTCRLVKCYNCVQHQIVMTYCPGCLSFFNNEHKYCTRNCFECPECNSNLIISAVADSGQRNFKFKCSSCHYKYSTGPILKAKSLTSFMVSKLQDTQYYRQFVALKNSYLQHNPQNEKRNIFKRFPVVHEDHTIAFDELIQEPESTLPYAQYLKSQLQYDKSSLKLPLLLPTPKRLRAKKRVKCKCGNILCEPSSLENFKFNKSLDAIKFLPKIAATEYPNHRNSFTSGSQLKFLLTLTNPYKDRSVTVVISTFDETSSMHQSKVTLPCNRFELGYVSHEHDFLATIPTVLLTKNTKASKLELLKRVSKSAFWSKIHDTNLPGSHLGISYSPANKKLYDSIPSGSHVITAPYIAASNISRNSLNSSQENLHEDLKLSIIDDDTPLDEGTNWCTIPLNVTLSEDANYQLKIPLFLTVESEEYSFGFWAVILLNEIKHK